MHRSSGAKVDSTFEVESTLEIPSVQVLGFESKQYQEGSTLKMEPSLETKKAPTNAGALLYYSRRFY